LPALVMARSGQSPGFCMTNSQASSRDVFQTSEAGLSQ